MIMKKYKYCWFDLIWIIGKSIGSLFIIFSCFVHLSLLPKVIFWEYLYNLFLTLLIGYFCVYFYFDSLKHLSRFIDYVKQ